MATAPAANCTAFVENRQLASGLRDEVAAAIWQATSRGLEGLIMVFDDSTGRTIDLDQRGTPAGQGHAARGDVATAVCSSDEPRRPGRPKLGVVAREVTLLPRHWEWLAAQPGGASVALRRLVEDARRSEGGRGDARRRLEAAYHFMTAMAGDLPHYEEATRALFAKDAGRLRALVAGWPGDLARHALKLAFAEG
jgi:hypothetical protein